MRSRLEPGTSQTQLSNVAWTGLPGRWVSTLQFENCALLGYYAASSGNFLPTLRDNLFLTLEDGTDGVFRNVGKKLPLLVA